MTDVDCYLQGRYTKCNNDNNLHLNNACSIFDIHILLMIIFREQLQSALCDYFQRAATNCSPYFN
jgi:hypothetical protein